MVKLNSLKTLYHVLILVTHVSNPERIIDAWKQAGKQALKYACCGQGCVVVTPAMLYQLLAKERVTGWVTPKTDPTLPCWRGIIL